MSPRREGSARRRIVLRALALAAAPWMALAGLHASRGPSQAADAPQAATPSPRAVVSSVAVAAEGEATRIRLRGTGQPQYRLVSDGAGGLVQVELAGVSLEGLPPQVPVGDGTLESVTLQSLPAAGARVSLRLSGDGNGSVEPVEDGLDVVVSLTRRPPMPKQSLAVAQVAAGEADLAGGGAVADLGFRQEPTRSLVEVGLSIAAPYEVTEASGERVVLDIRKTALPPKFRRALDTSAFSGAVKMIAAYERGSDVRVVVDLRRPVPYHLTRNGGQITLAFEGGSDEPRPSQTGEVRTGGREIVVIEGAPQGAVPQGAAQGGSVEVRQESASAVPPDAAALGYTGRRLSMDFVDADIRNVLRIIGEVSGLNVVAGDGVQGKVTVRMVDVPWDQALDVILKTRGLDQVREGNVIRIAPAEKIAQERAKQEEARKTAVAEAPLFNDIIPVNYATAGEVLDKVQAVLSERGSVSVDQRTNALLVKDTAERLAEVRELVARLDTQTPQVLIEARIVEVASSFARDLGIQWGGSFNADTAHGSSTGWAFPHSINAQGSSGVENFAVNLPAAVGAASPGGALALTFGSIDDVLTLDLRLSAIESSGRGRVVSSPRVTTLDNKTAEISQGIEIPFTTATEEKIETSSIDYKLKLNVTPHVTSDRSIIMKIDVTKDAPSTTFFAVDSRTPAKETRAATTEVLVKDGETTVIGGIITDTQGDQELSVPFLGKIPYLGALFRKKEKRVDKTELIIFITPKIANLQSVARNP